MYHKQCQAVYVLTTDFYRSQERRDHFLDEESGPGKAAPGDAAGAHEGLASGTRYVGD